MKNLIFVFIILFGSMFCACNGHTTVESTVDSVEVITDSVPADSLVVDSVLVDTLTVDSIR